MVIKQLRLFFAVIAMGLAVLAGCAAPTSPASNADTTAADQSNVPRIRANGGETIPMATAIPAARSTTPTTPPSGTISLALFVDPSWKTSNASVIVDSNGGKHVAFYYDEAIDEQRPTAAVYAYCSSQCEHADRWQRVSLAERVNEVQLALTPAGTPRLLIRTNSTVYAGGHDYHFAACDTACIGANGWTVTYLLSSHGTATSDFQEDELPQRSFALDPAGQPRFVYMDKNTIVNPNHLGVFYVFCDTDCTQQASWQETRINELIPSPFRMDHVYYPSLTFTPDGKPRLATADFFPINDGEPLLTYFECDDACENGANWHKVTLLPRGGGAEASADIEVDAAGRPRIAFYQEAQLDNKGKRLSYLWCDDACLDATNWQQRDVGLKSFDGQEPDLELDHHGRPRIAYADWNSGGLGYAWCNEQCDTPDARWEHTLIETRTELEAVWNVPFPRDHCDAGQWNSVTPTLAFGADGDPHVAYDATFHARCFYDDDPTDNIPPEWRHEQVMRAVRLIAFEQPFTVPSDPPTSTTPTATPTPKPTATPAAPPTPTATPTPSPTPVPIMQGSALFADTQWRTGSASVAVDQNGGQHMAFYYDEAHTAGGPTHAVYRSCASGCENPANWQSVALADEVNEVQLELTPAGNPRLLIRRASTTHQGGYDYLYAQCDSDCTQERRWELVQVASARGGASYEQQDARQPQRSFELDPNGRPRFVYLDDNPTADLHVGVFYAWCDEECTNAAAWQEVRITELSQWNGEIEDQERALYLALAFTPDGKPRLITAEFFPLRGGEARLAYIACDDLCEMSFLWQKVQLYTRGDGPLPAADLEIDAQGHPHVTFYQGKTEGVFPDGSRPTLPESLLYATCAQSHCMTAWNWEAHHIGVSGSNGPGPDLELDVQGRPRIAYTHGEAGGIGYSWCNADCLSFTQPSPWQHGVIERRTDLQTAWPMNDPAHCEGGGWQGWAPTLVIPATGNPELGYDAAYVAHCFYDDTPNDANGHADVVLRAARLVTFTQP